MFRAASSGAGRMHVSFSPERQTLDSFVSASRLSRRGRPCRHRPGTYRRRASYGRTPLRRTVIDVRAEIHPDDIAGRAMRLGVGFRLELAGIARCGSGRRSAALRRCGLRGATGGHWLRRQSARCRVESARAAHRPSPLTAGSRQALSRRYAFVSLIEKPGYRSRCRRFMSPSASEYQAFRAFRQASLPCSQREGRRDTLSAHLDELLQAARPGGISSPRARTRRPQFV